MKKITKFAALILAAVMITLALTSCSGMGTPVMELGGTEITENMIEFWLSRYKAQFVHYYGKAICEQYDLDNIEQFWNIKSDSETGETFDEVMSGFIYDNAKTYLCSLYLFDQFGLKLPDETVEKIDKQMEALIEDHASGSKSEFNTLLSNYGVNYNILRELYLIDEKVEFLQEHLFGVGGTLGVTSVDKDNYYKENYIRIRQICIFINKRPVTNEQGEFVTDENGYTKYEDMTADQTQEARKRADDALKKLAGGEEFQSVSKTYDENTADDVYVGGIYISKDSAMGTDEALEKIYNEVVKMEIGQRKLIETEGSLHIVEKMELDDKAYDKTENADFFKFYDPDTQTYITYEGYLREPLFLQYISDSLEKFSADIKIDEEKLKAKKLSNVQANYYY